MSEFSGGFLLHRVDAGIQQPVIDATRSYLLDKNHPLQGWRLCFATQRGCPVMHVAVRGPGQDNKDAYLWHSEHPGLGGLLARAIGQSVWTYVYENQVGSASVWRFNRDGRGGHVSSSTPDFPKRPLDRLAEQLNLHRELLEMQLAYFTPDCSLPLDGSVDPEALARYLAGPLKIMREPPNPRGDKALEVLLLSSVAEEVLQLSEQLELPPGILLWAAWEAGKAQLHRSTSEVDRFGKPIGSLRTPKSSPPGELSLPPRAPEAPPLPPSSEKVKLPVLLSKRVIKEAQALADTADRSLNWALQQAWIHARARMRAAVRADSQPHD